MNEQELMNVPVSTASSPAPASPENVPQIAMPVYYINQPVKPPGTPTSTTDMPTPILFGTGNGNPKRFAYTNQQLVYTNPICRSFAGNQIIKLATTTSGGVQYVPMGQVYPPSKAVKDNNSKKLFVTSINSAHNNKSNQVNLIIPSNQTTTSVNKPPITNLTLPNMETVPNKGTLTLVPNNPAGVNTNKQTVTSLLLPANAKYPNIAPNKKLFIPHILPQQNVTTNKQTSVPNIIRQTNNPTTGKNVVGIFASNSTNQQMTSLLLTQNANNKNPQSSVNLILPTSAGSHGLIVPHSVAGQTHSILVSQSSATQNSDMLCTQTSSAQTHGVVAPQAAGGIIMAPTSEGQAHLANVVLTTNSTHATTPVTSLLISNNSSTAATLGVNVNSASQTTSILVPVSMGPNSRPTHILTPQVGPYNKKTTDKSSSSREKKQSVLSKGGVDGNFPSLPPLQPISSKDGVSKSLLANGLNVPNSLVMTPITDGESLKSKLDRISDEMTIERTPSLSADDRGTSMTLSLRTDEKMPKTDEEICKFDKKSKRGEDKSDMGASMTCLPPLRGSKGGDVLLDDGEMTISMTRLLGPSREEYLEKLQLDYDMTIEVVKPEKPKIPPPRYQKPEDLDPMDVLEWDQQGVGKLPGSNIKFRINEFGLDLVVDSNKEESTTNTPNSSRRNSDERQKSPTPSPDDKEKGAIGEGPDKIYCCEGCGCYGLYTEFLTDTRFCSIGCKKIVIARNEIKKKRMDDKMRELRLRRKRRKIKILAQRARKGAILANSKEQFMEKTDDQLDKADINKAWANKMAELRRAQKSSEGKIKINMSDEDSRAVTPVSDSEASENISRSSIPSVPSEDDASSDKTAELKETNFLSSSGEFLWSSYLNKVCNKAKSAPVKLFNDPFPYGKNGFKVGMKLEGIDPEHQAIISVLTVAQVKGHRIRLHFDGFPDLHDFWTNSDSPDIFPPGWCERNNHTLDPPRGYSPDTFNWNNYLKQCRASPAPKGLFPKSNAPLCPSQFRAGMKLEAVDRKNSSLICVASVSNLIDNRLLIHFDSWGDVYDYWADPTSPYIHPVGWCEENGYDLTPPNNFKTPTSFSWEAYLKETKAAAAPARAFKPRPPNAFRRGMKLEAIDKRSPSSLRPATVKEVKDYQIKIGFDGYPEEFGYWVDDDCTDIHPIGWGHKTGYPVTPPPMMGVKSECGTEGCTGDGNMKGGFLTRHTSAIACPYSAQNLERENFPDRFCANPGFYEVPEPISKSKGTSTKQDGVEDSSSSESRVKTRLSSSSQKDENKQESHEKSAEPEEKTEERVERRGRKRKLPDAVSRVEQQDKLRKELIQTVFDPGYRPAVKDQEMWTKHVATLGHKVTVTGGDPRSWNHKQVAAFVNTVIPSRAKIFLDQEIDGESFLMLTQVDLTKVLGLKLGPAIKIYNCIILLRQKVMSL